MAVYGHVVRDFNNFNMAYHRDGFYMVARNVSGSLCFFNINRPGQILRPFYYIAGRLPLEAEQNSQISKQNGGIQGDIAINHYPFVPITRGFIEAREGATVANYGDDDLAIESAPVTYRDNSDNLAVATNLDNWAGKRQGVEVARGKPSILISPAGGLVVIYAYSESFNVGNVTATCPPFIGRVYAQSSFDGIRWSPPICILNMSLFNPPAEVFKLHFSEMLDYFDENANIFSSAYNQTFYNETSGLRSTQKLTTTEISNISCQDFDATYDNTTGRYSLAFWFGGFICYRDISQEVNTALDWASRFQSLTGSIGTEEEPYAVARFQSIYNLQNGVGDYLYTKAFWTPSGPGEIYIAAGPAERLLSNSSTVSPEPDPGQESVAATILKAIGGADARNTVVNLNTAQDSKALLNERYDPNWKGVFPPAIVVKFDNLDYAGEQVKQSPAIGVGTVGETMIAFYNSSNNISYIPVRDYNRQVMSGYPKLLVSN